MMLRACRLWTFAAVVWLLAPTRLGAQVTRLPPVLPSPEQYPGQNVSHADWSPQLPGPVPEPATQQNPAGWLGAILSEPPEQTQGNPDRPADARDGVFQKLIFNSTWLDSGGAGGFGLVELELKSVLALPVPSRHWPMTVTPGFGVNYLDGPVASDLPPRVYNAAVELRWWRRLAPRFGVDFAITPGLWSDFAQSTDEAVRIPGHVVGMLQWTPALRVLAGVAYLDREDVGVLPVGGLIWTPHDDLKFELAVPRPCVARRIYWLGACADDVQDWAYLAGEFGGGTWAIRRAAGANDVFTYRDYRLVLGVERKAVARLDARLEIGYVFSRVIEYQSDTPDVSPSDTVMLRGGLTY